MNNQNEQSTVSLVILVCIVYVMDSLFCQLIGNSCSTMKNSSILYLDTEVSAMCLPALSVFLGIVLVRL